MKLDRREFIQSSGTALACACMGVAATGPTPSKPTATS
jgi:hypothetical protein